VSIDGFGLAGAFFLEDDGESLPLPLDELEEPLLLLLLLLDATVDGNFKGWRNRFAKSSSSSSSSSQSCKPDGTACFPPRQSAVCARSHSAALFDECEAVSELDA
jgi:hypothetical protein